MAMRVQPSPFPTASLYTLISKGTAAGVVLLRARREHGRPAIDNWKPLEPAYPTEAFLCRS